jgi:hypothetical protein
VKHRKLTTCDKLGQNAAETLQNHALLVRNGRTMWLAVLMFCLLSSPTVIRAQEVFEAGADRTSPDTRTAALVFRQQSVVVAGPAQEAGTIRGTVVDATGAPVVGARVRLFREGSTTAQETVSDEEGQFRFADVAPGPFRVTTAAEGFVTMQFGGTLGAGENYLVPALALVVAGGSTEVQVTMTRVEIAEAEIRDEEKQRVLGVVPNFYVTYNPAAVPLTVKQKFELAWKATIDPVNFGLNAATAGIEQATDAFSGYGQGAQGYAKRYGASYADLVTGTFIGSAVLPAVLKQDPRYFYKGTGTRKSRVLYAIANAVICKGDNGRWQPNYSAILGGIAAGGISNLYYPSSDRGAGLVFENALIGVGTTAAANILQEFVIRKLTPHAPTYAPVTVTP